LYIFALSLYIQTVFQVSVSLFLFIFLLQDFMVYLLQTHMKPHTSPLGGTKGLKELVVYAKCNRDSCESELDS